MIKYVISFTEPQLAWLKQEAQRLGISVAELVRRITDQARQQQDRQGRDKDA